jgi:Family of unknown function (DUF6338)
MPALDLQTLVLFIYFVVPGFVMVKAFDLIVPTERRSFGDSIVEVISYSFIVLVIWIWPLIGILSLEGNIHPVSYYGLLFVTTILIAFVTPAFLAWRFYKSRTVGFLRGKTPHPAPTSWDWFFEQGKIYWVRFHLKDGEKLGGYYGANSFATSFPNTQQVYVEELWRLDEEGTIVQQVTGTRGAIINKEDCELIEFLEVQEATDNDQG